MVGCVGWPEGQPAGKCQELLRKNKHRLSNIICGIDDFQETFPKGRGKKNSTFF